MKVKFFPVVLLSLGVSVWLPAGKAQAQDKGLAPNELLEPPHVEGNTGDDKALPPEHETKSKIVTRDSSTVHNKPAGTRIKPTLDHKNNTAPREEDDALSFNFLYYIIQKFKISDLVDE